MGANASVMPPDYQPPSHTRHIAEAALEPTPQQSSPPERRRCLVVILAQTRAHELTWSAFKTNVLDALNADLAVCGSYESENPFTQAAKYKWRYDEVDDWADAYRFAASKEGLDNTEAWRTILKVKDQLFGGIKDPHDQHPGSAGILLFFRWFLLHNLKAANLDQAYDRYIITRSDYIYSIPHPPLELLDDTKIWIPKGEDYGGVTDRHIVVPKAYLEKSMNLMDSILKTPDTLYEKMRHNRSWNLEKYIEWHFKQNGIFDKVARFNRCMYAVRGVHDKTRWAVGTRNAELGYYIKYSGEHSDTQAIVKRYADNGHKWDGIVTV
jgi:hypothetical protein